MGDLVEGIGDEVLLFGAFLAFTAGIVIVVNLWQGRTGRDRQARAPQGKYKLGTNSAWLKLASFVIYGNRGYFYKLITMP